MTNPTEKDVDIAQSVVYPENNPMDAIWKQLCDDINWSCVGEELESIKFRIAQALADQRERDAKIAEMFDNQAFKVVSKVFAITHNKEIASKIRKGE